LSPVIQRLLSVDRLFTSRQPWPAHRCTDTAKQKTVAYLSGRGWRGQKFLPPGADNPSYTTASAQECKCGHYSLPLYRKQEKSLFTVALEQTSNVSTARDVGRSSGRVRRRACGFPIPIPGVLSAIAFPHRVPSHGAGDPVSARRFTRPSSRNVDRLFSGDSAAHRPWADGRCASPVALILYPPTPQPFCYVRVRTTTTTTTV